MKRTTIRIPEKLHEKLREISYKKRESVNTIIIKAVESWIKKEEG
jgi:predicted HicB family RNase H-like nuclease